MHPAPVRTTEFAPAVLAAPEEEGSSPAESFGYRPAVQALPWKRGRFSGGSFALQSDGTLRCPAGQMPRPTEQRREHDGTLRVLSAARIRDGRGCQLRAQCQWHGTATHKPRRVSLLWQPLRVGSAPVLWKDWSRRQAAPRLHAAARGTNAWRCKRSRRSSLASSHRRCPSHGRSVLDSRLSWTERLGRNARAPTAGRVTISLFGVPAVLAAWLGLPTA